MKKINFNKDWEFRLGGGSSLEEMLVAHERGKTVMLPHDASIELTRDNRDFRNSGNGFFSEKNCVYTKEFEAGEEYCNKNVFLEFEGVYQNAFVYVNNAYVGKCPYGYSNFYLDITQYVKVSEKNTIKVIVKNGISSGRWYTGTGIYRDVNIMIADRLHICPDGIRLSTQELDENLAVVRVEADVEYTGTGMRDVRVKTKLKNEMSEVVAEANMKITVKEHSKQTYQMKLFVRKPELWDAENPYLYQYQVEIEEVGEQIDVETGTFGIRKLQLDQYQGLRVNGKTIKLRGGCIHHDNGIIGAREFAHAAQLRIIKMKEAGYNAVRSAHYPMSRKLLEACDRLGMYVMDEFSDVWTTTKVEFDYGVNMSDWWEHDITNLVKKDYNHPCVIMYSIGNEIPEIGNKYDVQWGKKLADKIRKLDDTRYVTNSMNLMLGVMSHINEILGADTGSDNDTQEINSMMNDLGSLMDKITSSRIASEMTEEAASQVDIVGYNYAAARYEQDGKDFPNRILVGSETYPQDLDINWTLVEKLPYVIGDFAWTAWDYLGEAGIGKVSYSDKDEGGTVYAAYPYKAAYCGDINLLGDRRPVSYWREVVWGLRKKPYIAVQPPKYYKKIRKMARWSMTDAVRSWNWEGFEGKPIRVEVYTDADEIELCLNGTVLEKKKVGLDKKNQVIFETLYEPGTIEAIAYTNGVKCSSDNLQTASEKIILSVTAENKSIPADGNDICFVDLRLEDENGVLNVGLDKKVTVEVDGPGEIIGFGSANPESEENYFDKTAGTFEGRVRAAVRGTGEKGIIYIKFSAEEVSPVSLEIEAL